MRVQKTRKLKLVALTKNDKNRSPPLLADY